MSAQTNESGSYRSSITARSVGYAFQALALVFLGACSNEPQRLMGPSLPGSRLDIGVEGTDAVVCVSSDSPAGNYTFVVNNISFGLGGNTVAGPNPAVVARGTCFTLVSRLTPADESNPAADPSTSVTYSYTSNDVAGGADYAGTLCVDDQGIPASSPCGTTVTGYVNFVAGSTATFSFIQTPAQMIAGLRVTISNLDLPMGTAKSLDNKLRDALKAISRGRGSDGCNELDHFIKDLADPKGKKIGTTDAANLAAAVREIQLALGC
ncbi:MAG: hypothetical protein ABI875_05135 [Gemmatimonadales bacterium]